jgi:LysM repeat protein
VEVPDGNAVADGPETDATDHLDGPFAPPPEVAVAPPPSEVGALAPPAETTYDDDGFNGLDRSRDMADVASDSGDDLLGPPIAPDGQETGASGSYYANSDRSAASTMQNDAATYPTTSAPEFPFPGPMNGPANFTSDDPPSASSASSGSLAADSGFEASWLSVQADVDSRQYGNALMTLSAWYREPSLSSEQQTRCLQLLDQLAGTVIYSRESYLEPAHVVGPRETLEQIAEKYQVKAEFLARLNGVEAPYELYPGESLKVVQGPFRAELDRQSGELTLFLGRHYAGRFQVRVGKEMPAGENDFEVIAFASGREYFDQRSGYRVGPDHPENPYGSRWIGLRGNKITAAHNVGIHVDTGHPDRCCLGVSDVDAEDLAAILTVGSRLTVTP